MKGGYFLFAISALLLEDILIGSEFTIRPQDTHVCVVT